MKVIALTGGIASGKSTVAGMLAARGAAVIDADLAARAVVEPGRPALTAIRQRFGPSVLTGDGRLDRTRLGELVFSDPASRRDLDAITHPAIRALMAEQLGRAEQHGVPLAVMDIPLLFETGSAAQYQGNVMLVHVPSDIQLQRLMNRDGLSEAQARARLESQDPIDSKRNLATWVIDNAGEIQETQRQIDRWWKSQI